MTLEELYGSLHSSFDEALSRLQKRTLIDRLLKMFVRDQTMETLAAAIRDQDAAVAFRATHTAKGVALNLGFQPLAEVSSTLTEILRGNRFGDGYMAAYQALEAEYRRTVEAVEAYLQSLT